MFPSHLFRMFTPEQVVQFFSQSKTFAPLISTAFIDKITNDEMYGAELLLMTKKQLVDAGIDQVHAPALQLKLAALRRSGDFLFVWNMHLKEDLIICLSFCCFVHVGNVAKWNLGEVLVWLKFVNLEPVSLALAHAGLTGAKLLDDAELLELAEELSEELLNKLIMARHYLMSEYEDAVEGATDAMLFAAATGTSPPVAAGAPDAPVPASAPAAPRTLSLASDYLRAGMLVIARVFK